MNPRLDVVIVVLLKKTLLNQPAKRERGLWEAVLGQATPHSDHHAGVKPRNVFVLRKTLSY